MGQVLRNCLASLKLPFLGIVTVIVLSGWTVIRWYFALGDLAKVTEPKFEIVSVLVDIKMFSD